MSRADSARNADPAELDKFSALAAHWWDSSGPMAPLHAINPLRLSFIERFDELAGLRVLDVGCGGGILTEGLARAGARASGVDLAEDALEAGRVHARSAGLQIDYRCCAIEDLAASQAGEFDLLTCMEMLEHVPDPAAVVQACARLLKPGGALYLSTLNRNPKSFLMAIVGAEHLLRIVPRGTHDYARFIRPSELAGWCRQAGLVVDAQQGLHYNPLTRTYSLQRNVDVNYLMRCHRP